MALSNQYNLGIARCGKNLLQMNTIAKVGRSALKTLFSKMSIFGDLEPETTPTREVVAFPKIPEKRHVILEKNSPDMEKGGYRSYFSITKGHTKRKDRCKVFTWSTVIGLVEIPLAQFKIEDTLFGMVCTTHKLIPRSNHMVFQVPTHIIIAENTKGLTLEDKEGPTFGNILSESETEVIVIYPLEQVWRQMIWDAIGTFEHNKHRS